VTPPSTQPPETISGYRIVRKIGEGGMGVVYEAEQLEPVQRKVAVKVIKAGMDSKTVVARFESERQALAMMNHPNIARVYDAGTTKQGRPYFAMEYISGEPITRYCDDHRLETRERLELFTRLCDGVQHAHHKGVIHRDIKPSNVLVRILDDRPVPTIIDFGIAKATQQPLTEKTMFTAMGLLIGTPEYMSPEQAEMTGLDVDTRTDVYSLGVLLYELLVGALPFDSRTLRDAGLDEIRRRIREDEPSKPSTKVTTLGEATSGTAERRRTDPRSLRRLLKGDLDWITMKALEKDRTRRYASPAEMAADIDRHLRHEPVLAGPPGMAYRTKKFLRRHRVGVAVGAALLAALLIGIAGMTVGLLQAREQKRTAQRVSIVLTQLFADINPNAWRETAADPKEVLDRAAGRIIDGLEGKPLAQAQLMLPLGDAYWGIGHFDRARMMYEGALNRRRDNLAEAHPDVAESSARLGEFLYETGEYDEAVQLLESSLQMRRKAYGPDHTLVGRSLRSLGNLYWKRSELDKARSYLERALRIEEKNEGAEGFDVSQILHLLAMVDLDAGDNEAALSYLERSLRIREEVLGPEHITVSSSLGQMGRAYLAMGELEPAESNLRRAVQIVEQAGGAEHPNLGLELMNLGRVLMAKADYEGARATFERALANQEKNLGANHPNLVYTLRSYGELLSRTGDLDGAREKHERALRILENAFGSVHIDVARVTLSLGYVEYEAGNHERARSHFERALESYRAVFGPEHEALIGPLYSLARLSALSGDPASAITELREAVDCGLDRHDLLHDPALDSVRDDPEFQALVERVRMRTEP
jgi:tetratricopeptide (TPR) repeat protein/predicted Ser/Thr protein kinase